MADNCHLRGLNLPDLSDDTREEIAGMQRFGTAQNPLDLTGQIASDPELFTKCLTLLEKDENIDIMLIIFTNVFGEFGRRILATVEKVMEKSKKPFIGMITGGSITDDCMKPAEKGSLPLFRAFHESLRSIKTLADFALFKEMRRKKMEKEAAIQKRPLVNLEEIRGWLKKRQGSLTEDESKSILAKYGIPITREGLSHSLAEAKILAKEIGYPVAMKVISPQILHKTEAQAIRLNVGEEELEQAYHQLLDIAKGHTAEIRGVLVQEMVEDGAELIVGISRDKFFGPIIIFGLGGIYVEILKDVSLRLPPVDRDDALGMIQEIKGYEILAGARGRPKVDIEALAQVILKLSHLALDLGDLISAVDINPLIVSKDGMGVKAVDALVVLEPEDTR
jgi:acetyltransferase